MREIKFRGRCISIFNRHANIWQKWLYGSLLVEGRDYFIKDPRYDEWILVDHDTVGQYIGFKDINNADIYDGDIVEHPDDVVFLASGKKTGDISIDRYIIFWNETKWCKKHIYCSRWHSEWNNYGALSDCFTSISKHKILGNRWENPELI